MAMRRPTELRVTGESAAFAAECEGAVSVSSVVRNEPNYRWFWAKNAGRRENEPNRTQSKPIWRRAWPRSQISDLRWEVRGGGCAKQSQFPAFLAQERGVAGKTKPIPGCWGWDGG